MNSFRFDQHPITFMRPRITPPYAWVGHIPFAYLLVDLLRPRRLVELGTDSGNSYLAFCQAIERTGAKTQATAIDSWEGDPHARFYGEAVYTALSGYHDPRYGGFSRLMRCYFDDAVEKFKDGSIDLLHIDGLHTYDAVRHDFETWLPKLSDRAVVIFHDSQVRERGFGVWKFIEELGHRHRCFEFEHSNGLAVVQVGDNPPASFKTFMDHALAHPEVVKEYFEAIAATILDPATETPVAAAFAKPLLECKIYYRDADQLYEETRTMASSTDIDSGPADFVFTLPADFRPDYLRIDPADAPGVYGLRHIRFKSGRKQLAISNDAAQLRSINGEALPAEGAAWLRFANTDGDPHVELVMKSLWKSFQPGDDLRVEIGVDYESLVTDPIALRKLAKLEAEVLGELRELEKRHWSYTHLQAQLRGIEGSADAAAKIGLDLSKSQALAVQHLENLLRSTDARTESIAAQAAELISQHGLGISHLENLLGSTDARTESIAAQAAELIRQHGLGIGHLENLLRSTDARTESIAAQAAELARQHGLGIDHLQNRINALQAQLVQQCARADEAILEHIESGRREQREALASGLDGLQAKLAQSEKRYEEIRSYQLHLSDKLDVLARQSWTQRLRRLFRK